MQKVKVSDVEDNKVVSITEIKKVRIEDDETKKYDSLNHLIKEIFDADVN
jgi:hypothetical protein